MYYAQNRGLKSGLRNFIKSSAAQIAGQIPFNALLKLSGRNSILPFYHAVSDEDLPHIKQLYQLRSSALFEKDLDFLLKHYRPIDLFELIEINLNKKSSSSKGYMHLSFDDGLSSCHEVIAPILQKKGIPATFFLNSAFIDNKALMFRYKVSLCIESLSKIDSKYREDILKKSKDFFEKENPALANYNESAKLDELANLLQLDFDAYLREKKPYMNTNQIQNLLNQGFSIGSHSVDHPLYSKISLEQQLTQTIESQDFLEQKFAINYRVFAFPFTDYGVKKDFFRHIFEKERFDLSFGAAGLKEDRIQQNLQRFPMESQNNDSAKKMLSSEYLYYLLKMSFGKHHIVR
jgi:peptidoglycan/xylan/chitin deacetylase (PgdA/CDA1 family)